MLEKAQTIVRDYIDERMGQYVDYSLFVVWQSTVLQNFKCLIATTLSFGAQFLLTYDGDEKCWYVDVYQKTENRVIYNA